MTTRRDTLIQAGRVLYGPAWQSALARDLGPLHPDGPRDKYDDRTIRRWAAGQRSIPDWALTALRELLRGRSQAAVQLLRDLDTLIREEGA
jgi:hypothetical protein